jgi:hypothetical protein
MRPERGSGCPITSGLGQIIRDGVHDGKLLLTDRGRSEAKVGRLRRLE